MTKSTSSRTGGRARLPRAGMGAFSSFAASFAGLSVLTGLFQVWFIGYAFAGPAFIWFWPIVFAGQLAVALVFAEMAARFPFAGAAYQWARKLGGHARGWMTGWLYLLAQLLTLPAAVVAMQLTLPVLWPGFNFSDDFAKNSVILGLGTLVLVTLINVAGVRLMAIVNNIGVAAEIGGALFLIIALAVHVHRGPATLVETNGTGSTHAWGFLGAVLVSGFMALYNMYAFDTAATLSEETDNPSHVAPRAVLRSLVTAGTIGFLILVLSLLAIPDLRADELGTVGLPYIISTVLGPDLGKLMLISVTIAIFVCSLAIQAWTARTVFAMGRDGELPGGAWLGRVNDRGVPVNATITTGVIGLVILGINLNNSKAFNVLVALGIVFIYLAYLSVTLIGLKRRRAGWPEDAGDTGLFTLRAPWGKALNVIAVLYGGLMLVNLAWPRAEFYGTAWYQQYAVVIFVPLLALAGWLYYVVSQREDANIRATTAPPTTVEQTG